MFTGVFKGVFRVCSGCVQGVFRVCSGCVQGVFRVCSGYLGFRVNDILEDQRVTRDWPQNGQNSIWGKTGHL